MGDDELHILQMLQDGLINAEEAEILLDAIRTEVSANELSQQGSARINTAYGDTNAPEIPTRKRYNRVRKIIHFLVIGSLSLSAIGLAFMYQSADQVALIGFLCVWPIFAVSLLFTIILFLTRSAPWLHLRFQRTEGQSISLSLPLPLTAADWAIRIASPFVRRKNKAELILVAASIEAMAGNPNPAPVNIELDVIDGARLEISFG